MTQNLIRKNPEVHKLVLEWFKEKAEASRVAEEVATLNDALLMEYWEKAENIISEFNEYGGGPEDEGRMGIFSGKTGKTSFGLAN